MATRILVINDTQDILEMFRLLLEGEGYEVVLASYPFQNVGEIEQLKPDLIILDMLFGDQPLGWQMLQRLKMQCSTTSTPVIVCTAALHSVQEQEGSLVSQCVRVIDKPFAIDVLLALITQASRHRHSGSGYRGMTRSRGEEPAASVRVCCLAPWHQRCCCAPAPAGVLPRQDASMSCGETGSAVFYVFYLIYASFSICKKLTPFP